MKRLNVSVLDENLFFLMGLLQFEIIMWLGWFGSRFIILVVCILFLVRNTALVANGILFLVLSTAKLREFSFFSLSNVIATLKGDPVLS